MWFSFENKAPVKSYRGLLNDAIEHDISRHFQKSYTVDFVSLNPLLQKLVEKTNFRPTGR